MIRILTLALALCPALALAQMQVGFGSGQQDTDAPVEVTADQLSVNQSDGTALYSGDVLVVQGDMRLAAPRVLVVYNEAAGEIERFEATGGVVMVSGEEAAEADRADYTLGDGVVVMSGNVLVTQGPSALSSERMVVNLETGQAELTGRVRTVLQQGGDAARDGQ